MPFACLIRSSASAAVKPMFLFLYQLAADIDSQSQLDMAKSMGVSPSFLSATEVGTKKISDDFLNRVIEFFASKGIHISGIREAADVSNKAVSLEGLSTTQQFLVAGFARANMSKDQLDAFVKLLADTKKGG